MRWLVGFRSRGSGGRESASQSQREEMVEEPADPAVGDGSGVASTGLPRDFSDWPRADQSGSNRISR